MCNHSVHDDALRSQDCGLHCSIVMETDKNVEALNSNRFRCDHMMPQPVLRAIARWRGARLFVISVTHRKYIRAMRVLFIVSVFSISYGYGIRLATSRCYTTTILLLCGWPWFVRDSQKPAFYFTWPNSTAYSCLKFWNVKCNPALRLLLKIKNFLILNIFKDYSKWEEIYFYTHTHIYWILVV